ncbi:MAG: hypothetical protein HY286_08650 [Planctomycetes bacterium]|nr:hypothetical protein [Planctomycetota bacterium]
MDLTELDLAVRSDPNNAQGRLALGVALLEAGRGSDAIEHLRRAMMLQRDFLEAYAALGRALLAEGEHVAAIATLEGGREIARHASDELAVAKFDAALEGLGPVKRRGAGPLDDRAFHDVAAKTLAELKDRLARLPLDVKIQFTPGILVFDAANSKMGLSEQKTSKEIWCTSALGEFKFRYIGTSNSWKTADGDELTGVVRGFLARAAGRDIQF